MGVSQRNPPAPGLPQQVEPDTGGFVKRIVFVESPARVVKKNALETRGRNDREGVFSVEDKLLVPAHGRILPLQNHISREF